MIEGRKRGYQRREKINDFKGEKIKEGRKKGSKEGRGKGRKCERRGRKRPEMSKVKHVFD